MVHNLNLLLASAQLDHRIRRQAHPRPWTDSQPPTPQTVEAHERQRRLVRLSLLLGREATNDGPPR